MRSMGRKGPYGGVGLDRQSRPSPGVPAVQGALDRTRLVTIPSTIDSFKLTQQGRPFQACLDKTARAIHLQALLDRTLLGCFGERIELGAAREGIDLQPAGSFNPIDPDKRFANRLAD